MAARVIVGLDPARSFGWAVIDSDGRRIASGTWVFAKKLGFAGGVRTALKAIAVLIADQQAAGRHVTVAFEDATVMQKSAANANLYGGWFTAIHLAAEMKGCEVHGYLPGAVKETATGKRRADKPEMVEAARKRWRHAPGTDDEADALWVAETCRTKQQPPRSRTRSTPRSRRSKRGSTSSARRRR